MAKENDEMEDVIVITDEDGTEYRYYQEMILPVGESRFALLVPVPEEGHAHGCDCGCEDGEACFAKIVSEDGDSVEYAVPTDEEFEAVQKAYDALFEEDEK